MQSIEFTGFNSVNEATHPEKLKPNELAVLDNMVIDKEIGMISTRNGFASYSQPDTSGVINNLFDVEDANQNNYLLANVGTSLRKFFSNTWSDVKTGLTAAKMRMAAYGSSFIFTNGVDKPFYTDLTTTNNIAIDKPIVTGITATTTSGTDVVPVDARYIIAYVTNDNMKSNSSNQFRVLNTEVMGNRSSVIFGNLPVSSDGRVISKKIYRTKLGIFDTYYLLGEIDNSVTTYTDISTDAELNSTETIEYTNVPTSAKYIVSNGDRISLANITKAMTNRVIPPVFYYQVVPLLMLDNTQAGNLLAGTYKYAISFIDNTGNESELVPYFTEVLSASSKKIIFSPELPISSIDYTSSVITLNVGIKTVRVYRTKAGGSVYYWLQDNIVPYSPAPAYPITALWEDNTADSSLSSTVYPKETVHNALEITHLQSSVIYSNLYSFLEYPELNYLEVYPDDGDPITGIFDDDNGIMVFKENSICKIYTVGDPANWQVQKLVHNMGCDQPDSIIKRGSIYYFVWRNKVYEFSGGGEPKEISYKRKPTFDLVTSFQGAAFYNAFLWYVLTVKIGTVYYLLCYDTKLDTWYKFSISKADTVFEKIFGTDKGKLLFGGNLYITYYKDGQTNDTDSGTNDITVALKSKDFSFPDNFVIARLMFLFLNYLRLVGSASKVVNFTITDAVTGNSINLDDADETVLQPIYKIVTDGMDGDLKRVYKLNFSITGEAISKFFGGKLEYNVEPWRILRKYANQYGRHVTDDTDKIATDDTGAMPLDDGTAPSYDVVGGGGGVL